MSMTIVLLLIILILLVVIVVLMFTVWPRRQRTGIEKAFSALRREMAEQRGDSIRLMQAIRNEVEDAVRETLDREMTTFVRSSGHPQTSLQRPDAGAPESSLESTMEGLGANIGDTGDAFSYSEQLSLFEQPKPVSPTSSVRDEETGTEPQEPNTEEMEKIHIIIEDDIPDVDDMPDLDDTK